MRLKISSLRGVTELKQYCIFTGTVTYALKGRDLLRKNGFKAHIERSVSRSESRGCGYMIVISEEPDKAVGLLKSADVKILEISEM